mgnify:CR=1 FL=1
MIEVTLKSHLENALDVPVEMEIPAQPPARFIVIERTGTRMIEKAIEEATFAIQSYGVSLYDAALLQFAVRAAMQTFEELSEVCSVEVTGIYNYTDESIKKYRYQGVYSVIAYDE